MRCRIVPITALALGGLLAGCVPGGALYYYPSAAGGKTVRHHCEQTPSIVNFQIGPLAGHAWARKTKTGTLVLLDLGSYSPPKDTPPRTWRSFHFVTDRFAARNLVHGTTIGRLTYEDRAQDITGPATKPYFLEIHLPKITPDRFELLGPPVVIDGRQWPFPPIRFEYKLWIGLLPFNC